MNAPLTPAQQIAAVVRLLAVLLVLAAMGFAGWKVWAWRARAIASEGQVTALEGTAQATEATTGAAGDALAQRQQVDIVLHQGRAAAAQAIEELTHADPTAAELRARPMPDGLRDIYRARREARDRSAGAPPGG